MHIKRINPSEYHLVTGLFDKYRVFYKQSSDLVCAEKFIKDRLDNNESVIFAALEETRDKMIPLGFTQLYPSYSSVKTLKNWILNDLYVDEPFRKNGIARKLIDAAFKFAKDHNANYIQLETATDNITAQKLYESVHFVKQTPNPEFYLYKKEIK